MIYKMSAFEARSEGAYPKAEFLKKYGMPEATFKLLGNYRVGLLIYMPVADDDSLFWYWKFLGDRDRYKANKAAVDALGRRFEAWRLSDVMVQRDDDASALRFLTVQRELDDILDALSAVFATVA